ncbi:MAG: DUF5666 domain-containing protein [Acidobacteriaceae bacterium]
MKEIVMRFATRVLLVMVAIGLAAAGPGVRAQGGGHGRFAGMQRARGEVTEVSGDTFTVKTDEGATLQVVTTENTRMMKGRGQTVKVGDLKVGDGVMAAGMLDAAHSTLHAVMVFVVDAAQMEAMKANLGKTYIVGRVTAIDMDNARMTVERSDHVEQTIGFDETTSFRKGGRAMGGMFGGGPGMGAGGMGAGGGGAAAAAAGGESITLADIKVGEMVRGTGSVKNGIFVPTELVVMERGGHRAGGGAMNGSAGPGSQ